VAKDEKAKTKGAEAEPEAPAGGKKKIVVIAAAAVLLVGGGVGGYFFWTSKKHAEAEAKPATSAQAPQTKLLFYTIDPPFVANFEGMQSFRFLQVHVRVSTRAQDVVDLMASIDPVIRNDLLMLFSAQNAEALGTREGKEKLRQDALELVRKAVKNSGGDPKLVENVLFTSFVMQ
jgi:flagellar FliL protein